ncbi:MAG: hypothetical protein ACRCWY_08535 [Cellulosilyticaceae bacterium]
MGDVFKEQLVGMKMSSKAKVQQGIIWSVTVLVAITVFLFLGTFIASIVILGMGWGALFLTGKLKKEHEYILTNNELDIDVIYNKERRKKIMTIDLKKIDLMASIKDEKHKESLVRAQKSLNASDGEGTQDTYAILYAHNGELTRILITPNEEMLTLIYKQAPHKVMRYRG